MCADFVRRVQFPGRMGIAERLLDVDSAPGFVQYFITPICDSLEGRAFGVDGIAQVLDAAFRSFKERCPGEVAWIQANFQAILVALVESQEVGDAVADAMRAANTWPGPTTD